MNKIKLNINGGLMAWDGLFDILQNETQELTNAILQSFLVDKNMAILTGCNVTIVNSGSTNVKFSVSNGYIYYKDEDSIGEIYKFNGTSDVILPDYSTIDTVYNNYYFDLSTTETEYIEYENGTFDNVYIHNDCIITDSPASFVDAVLNMDKLTSFMDEATTSKYGIVKLASADSISDEVYTSTSFNEKKTVFGLTSVDPLVILNESNCKTGLFGSFRITDMIFTFTISDTLIGNLPYIDFTTTLNNVLGEVGCLVYTSQKDDFGGDYPYQDIRVIQQTVNSIRLYKDGGYFLNQGGSPTITIYINKTNII